jgi:hypothetical protein
VAVQRHAMRVSNALAPTINLNTDALQPTLCEDIGYVPGSNPGTKNGKDLVCIPPDPWNQTVQTWLIGAGSNVFVPGLVPPTLPAGIFATAASGVPGFDQFGEDRLVLLGATGLDFCQKGVQEGVGDVVSIVSQPPDWVTDNTCPKPTPSNPQELAIEEAYSDRLVLRVMGTDADKRKDLRNTLLRCFPDFFQFAVAAPGEQICFDKDKTDCLPFGLPPNSVPDASDAGSEMSGAGGSQAVDAGTGGAADAGMGASSDAGADEAADGGTGAVAGDGTGGAPKIYLVATSSIYLHRQVAGADGRCVIDDTKDPRLTSRAAPNEIYKNPFVAFTLTRPPAALVQVTRANAFLRESDFDPGASFLDAQPFSALFTPYANLLYVVDTASQGLRGFTLSPFLRSNVVFR